MHAQVRRQSNGVWETTHPAKLHDWVAPFNFQTTGGSQGTMQVIDSSRFIQGSDSSAHGGLGSRPLPVDESNNVDIDAIYVCLKAKLALIDDAGVDDRDLSNLVMVVGSDFYPDGTTPVNTISGATGWIPGNGYGRFRWLRREPRRFELLVRKPGVTDLSLLTNPPKSI